MPPVTPRPLPVKDCSPGHPNYRKITMQISADNYSCMHDESVSKIGYSWHGDAVFRSHDGVPLLQTNRSEALGEARRPVTNVLTVVDRKFEPIANEEFTPERLLGATPVKRIIRQPDNDEASGFLKWYPLPLVISAISLVAGSCLLPRTRGRRSPIG